jgi:clan AA aspartic protease (TIGR02281 family)
MRREKRCLPVLLATGAAWFALVTSAAGQTSPTASADALFRAGDFAAAGRAYEAVLKASPKDANALVGAARVRLLENKVDRAITLAQQALAADPANAAAQTTLRSAQQRKAVFAGEGYHFEERLRTQTSVPFVTTDPLPVVQVTIDGRQVYFFIDTGASDFVVRPDLAKALGLETQLAGEGVFAGGKRAPVERTTVPEIRIGSLTIKDVPAAVLGQSLQMGGFKTEGIIGTGFLMQFLPTLDYCQGRLVLRPRTASASVERAAARAGANIVPMWLFADHFILARAHLQNGAEHLYHIDTGMAGGGLMSTKAALDEAGIVVNPADTHTGVGGGGAVTFIPFRASATLGSMTVDKVPGSYTPNGNQYGIFPFEVAGTLSHMFFRHSCLTFDFEAMRLITQSC